MWIGKPSGMVRPSLRSATEGAIQAIARDALGNLRTAAHV
jgi:hypothetical protein